MLTPGITGIDSLFRFFALKNCTQILTDKIDFIQMFFISSESVFIFAIRVNLCAVLFLRYRSE